jgi:hypothetical protein
MQLQPQVMYSKWNYLKHQKRNIKKSWIDFHQILYVRSTTRMYPTSYLLNFYTWNRNVTVAETRCETMPLRMILYAPAAPTYPSPILLRLQN